MSSDPIEVLRELAEKWRGLANDAMRRSGTWSGSDMADRIGYMADELDAALASLSAPKPPSVNDNAVAVNESPDVNDKPENAEASERVCPNCNGEGGSRWYNPDGSEDGERCGLCDGFGHVPAPQQASAPVGVEGLVERWRTKKRGLSALGCANELEHALAQQPAAVDEAAMWAELLDAADDAYASLTVHSRSAYCTAWDKGDDATLSRLDAALGVALASRRKQQGGTPE